MEPFVQVLLPPEMQKKYLQRKAKDNKTIKELREWQKRNGELLDRNFEVQHIKNRKPISRAKIRKAIKAVRAAKARVV